MSRDKIILPPALAAEARKLGLFDSRYHRENRPIPTNDTAPGRSIEPRRPILKAKRA